MTSNTEAIAHIGSTSLETVDVLVIGATLTGLGLAYAGAGKTLVVERTASPGQECIACFHPGERLEAATVSPAADALREELQERGLLSDEHRLHLGALAPVLFNRIRRDGLNVRFLTEVIGIEPKGEEGQQVYTVTLFDASGLRHIRARHIVDTTAACLSSPGFRPVTGGKSINAMLHHTNTLAALPEVEDEAVAIVQGRFPGEVIFKLRLAPADDWPTARTKLHRYWASRPAAFGAWTMAIVADTFEQSAAPGPHRLGDRWEWLPANAYDNALQAFDTGATWHMGGDRA
ncbi:MAG: hypothetical protein K0Q59_2635 [Paenibacillus sp.]|nr:hypothetical protein [Paenibacillus sp.]